METGLMGAMGGVLPVYTSEFKTEYFGPYESYEKAKEDLTKKGFKEICICVFTKRISIARIVPVQELE